MSTIHIPEDTRSVPEIPGVEFGRTSDGFPVARLGDLLLAMLPRGSGDWSRERVASHAAILRAEARRVLPARRRSWR